MTLGITEQEATATVAAYRASHTIDPEYPRNTREPRNWCRTCGIDIYPVRGGFRHDRAIIGSLVTSAAVPAPVR